MKHLSRRSFTRTLLASSIVPVASLRLPFLQTGTEPTTPVSIPDSIAGHLLTADEKALVSKFLESNEKSMVPLRQQELPNALAPAMYFASPAMEKKTGGVQ